MNTCRHGETEPHGYGMEDEPDYDGGPIMDVWMSCYGPFLPPNSHAEPRTDLVEGED